MIWGIDAIKTTCTFGNPFIEPHILQELQRLQPAPASNSDVILSYVRPKSKSNLFT